MASASGVAVPGSGLSAALAGLAESLQRITVQVRGDGPGAGSGVIWRPDGLIVTNAHVARGEQATVELWDKRVFPAQVVARDQERDLASLQVEASGLPAATVGDSNALRVGELVVAVGHPLGMIGALTAGIIHSVGPAEGRRGAWVQGDLRLAPGNSGGPLANARGQVIGINSMIAGGLALAVPSAAVERFLQAQGRRPILGVTTRPVVLERPAGRALGLLILEIAPASAAQAAGLLIGDILLGAAGQAWERPEDLSMALAAAGFGAALTFDVLRGGRQLAVEATLAGDEPEAAQAA
jgi:serine protease Do